MLIGSKCDLENDRVISREQGQDLANELGIGTIGHHEISAKDNTNVNEVDMAQLSHSSMKITFPINYLCCFTNIFEEQHYVFNQLESKHSLFLRILGFPRNDKNDS